MKRVMLTLVLLLGAYVPSQAQSWSDMLKNFFSRGESKTEQVQEPAKSYPAAKSLLKSWTYTKAVVEYTGDDPLAQMAVGTLSGQIEGYVVKAGIQSGRDKIIFQRGGVVRVQIGEHTAQGTYTYQEKSGRITLSVEMGERRASLSGDVRIEGGHLTLLFDAATALKTMKAAVPELAQNDYVKIAETVVTSYPGILIGATF